MTDVLGAVERYYSDKVAEHGTTPRGVDWNGEESQTLRFEKLLSVLEGDQGPFTIIDFGCGYGALVEELQQRNLDFKYIGYDISSEMIAAATKRFSAAEDVNFTSEIADLSQSDFTIASGIFNVRLDTPDEQWIDYILETVGKLAQLSRRGVAFNALTAHSDPDRMRPDLFYADPSSLFQHCLTHHSRDVAIHHDYSLYEFTLTMRMDRRQPVQARGHGAPNE